MRLFIFSLLLLLAISPAAVFAGPQNIFEPISGSIKSHKVNVRTGPGTTYPILWVYKMRGYPVKAIAHFGGWYKVVDVEGEEGWIYQNFFTPRPTAMISAGPPAGFYKTRESITPKLLLEEGVIVLLERCALGMCEVGISGEEGWVKKDRVRLP